MNNHPGESQTHEEFSIVRDWALDIDVDMVLRGQGADPAAIRQRRPRLVEIAEQAIVDGKALLEPAVVYRSFDVTSLRHERLALAGGAHLSGSLLAQHLGPAEHVVLMVCTIGDAIEQRVGDALRSDPAYGLALDGFGSVAVEVLGVAACKHFEDQAAAEGRRTSIPLSPGMIGWPVDVGQWQIFGLLDAGQIGVTLTESAQMIPRKSTSMVLGVSRTPFSEGRTCDFCTLRETCRYQDHYTA